MATTNKKSPYWKDNWELLTAILVLSTVALYLGIGEGGERAKQDLAEQRDADIAALTTADEPEKPSFDFNGYRCTTLEREPTFHYRTREQTVTFMIECAPEVMDAYRLAVEPDEVE
tara:strand:+ start:1494 stop:1841 length:348 start_codon:yes stop_codon:yes gene_type:complete